MKKLFSMMTAMILTLVVMHAEDVQYFCRVAQSWWTADGAAVAAYAWAGEGETAVSNAAWPGVRMTPVEGDETLWSIALDPAKYEKVIFVRVNGEGELKNWGAQTADLTLPKDDKILFTITSETAKWSGDGDKVEGKWSDPSAVEPDPDPEVKYYITGDSAFVVDAGLDKSKQWDPKAMLVSSSFNEINLKLYQEYKMKITVDGTWETAKGFSDLTTKVDGLTTDEDNNIIFTLAEPGSSYIRVDYDGSTFKVSGLFYVKPGEDPDPEVAKFYITGDAAFVTAAGLDKEKAWDPKAIAASEDEVTLALEADQEYQMKITVDGTWDTAKGYSNLTRKPDGITTNDDDNIIFTLAEGETALSVTFNATKFLVAGKFKVEPEDPEVLYYIAGSMTDWQENKIAVTSNPYTLSLKAGDYQLKVIDGEAWKGFDDLTTVMDGLTSDKDGNICFTLAEDGDVAVFYTATEFIVRGNFKVEPEDPTVKFYITGSKELVGEEKAWKADAIAVEGESYTFEKLAAGDYKLKVTLKGAWEPASDVLGFDALTEVAKGLTTDGDGNICFTLKEAGDVKVIYSGVEPTKVVFSVEGNFYVKPDEPEDPTVKFYITGSKELVGEEKAWKADAIAVEGESYTFEKLVAGDYKLKVTLKGAWEPASDVLGFDALTEVAKGLTTDGDGNICFTLDEEGDVTVTYAVDKAGEVIFKLEGNFYVKPDDPEKALFYITGDSAFVVDAGLDKDKAWKADAIPVTKEDIYPINLKGNQEYQFKITLDGTWETAKGFDDLKHQEDFPGPYRADKDNIAFKLTEDAEVRIKYNEGDFKIESEKFYVAPEEKPKMEIAGAWEVDEDKQWVRNEMKLSADEKTASFEVELVNGRYEFKLIKDGKWIAKANDGEAYGLHREWVGVAGLTEVTENLAVEADVDGKYLFTWTFANDSIGIDFPEKGDEPETVKFYLTGDSALVVDLGLDKEKAWDPKAIAVKEDNFILKGLKADQEYNLKVIDLKGNWIGFEALTKVPEGVKDGDNHNINFKLKEAGDVKLYFGFGEDGARIFTLEGEFFVETIDPETKFFITGDAALVGKEKAWNPAAIAVTEDSYSFENLAAGEYKMKITIDGTWSTAKGFADLTNPHENLKGDADGNIVFYLASADKVTVSYTAEAFRLEGNFAVKPVDPDVSYYIAGTMTDWAENKIAVEGIRYQLNLEAGDHKLKLITVDGDWLGYDALSDVPEGVTTDADRNICFTLKEAGKVDISYDGKIFVIGGNFYVKPADELSVSAKGAWDDWGLELNFEVAEDKKTAALTVPLLKGSYEFKLIVNGDWRSNGYEFHRDFVGAAGITQNLEANMVLRADMDGEYTITWTFENDSLGITFPEKEEPIIEKVILYIVLNIDWEKVFAYAWSEEAKNAEWPGVELSKLLGIDEKPVPARVHRALLEGEVVYTYECPKEYANVIFNNGIVGEGAEQTSDLTWEEEKPVFVIDDEKNGEGKYDGEWTTTEEAKIPTALDIVTDGTKVVKVLYNGSLYIIKGDKTYNIQGQLVR